MSKYKLAPGTQVREEDFGLLFYTMSGPRLYFLGSGVLLGTDFFCGEQTLEQWLEDHGQGEHIDKTVRSLERGLSGMIEKGVILEC